VQRSEIRSTEPQSHSATEEQKRRATEPQNLRGAEIRDQNYRASGLQIRTTTENKKNFKATEQQTDCGHDNLRRNGVGARSMDPSIDPTSLQRSAKPLSKNNLTGEIPERHKEP
jgi:hypothetical protein